MSRETENKQAAALEQAILQRAEAQAKELRQQTHERLNQIQKDAAERQHAREERELLIAKAASERAYHRQVQASELRMQADLDRLRWSLVQEVMQQLPAQLQQLCADDKRYWPLFKAFLAQALQSIEREQLCAEVTPQDYQQLKDGWKDLVAELAPGKSVSLAAFSEAEASSAIGGVRVCSEDQRICVDNTFRGKLTRMEADLQQIVLERLLPSGDYMNLLFTR